MIGYFGQVSYSGYWPLDDEWPPPTGNAVYPLYRNDMTGEKTEIVPPFFIHPSIIPSSGGGSGGSDTFAFFVGN